MAFGTSILGCRRGSLRMLVARLEAQVAARPAARNTVARLAYSPAEVMTRADLAPDPWPFQLLGSTYLQIALLCSRQAGKSTVAAALAVRAAMLIWLNMSRGLLRIRF